MRILRRGLTLAVAAGLAVAGLGQPARAAAQVNHEPALGEPALFSPDRPCGTLADHPSAGASVYLGVHVTDPDPGDQLFDATFAFWPVEQPDRRTELAQHFVLADLRAHADFGGFADGTVLAWQVRAADTSGASSAWSTTCYLTVDKTAPAAAPVVTSRKYPDSDAFPGSGGPGVPGVFVVDGLGDPDVAAYDWYSNSNSPAIARITATSPGGRARFTFTPRLSGTDRIFVASVDAAGNRGPWTTYVTYVRDSAPSIVVEVGGVGLTSHIKLQSAGGTAATSYVYAVDGGPETTLAAVDGIGRGDLVFDTAGWKSITSRAYQGRKLLGVGSASVLVDDAPTVASDEFSRLHDSVVGRSGTFTFTPRSLGVVAYLYDFGDGNRKRIDAAADGTAVLGWTPERGAYYTLRVSPVTADGVVGAAREWPFYVIDNRPKVTSDAGDGYDGVGLPLNVYIASDLPGVTDYVYSFDGGPEQTVPFDYYQTVVVTPTHSGPTSFVVRSKMSDGTFSPATTATITVSSAPVVTMSAPLGQEAIVGRAGTITFRPGRPGTTAYRYTFDFGQTERTVAAGPDGSATVDFTPDLAGWQQLSVTGVGADGTTSQTRDHQVIIADPQVQVAAWSDWTVGSPGGFSFSGDLADVTTEYLWRVDDEPVRSATDTSVEYVPDTAGAHVFSVWRRFTDGTLSPVTEYSFRVAAAS